jgi:hypothetical protein
MVDNQGRSSVCVRETRYWDEVCTLLTRAAELKTEVISATALIVGIKCLQCLVWLLDRR